MLPFTKNCFKNPLLLLCIGLWVFHMSGYDKPEVRVGTAQNGLALESQVITSEEQGSFEDVYFRSLLNVFKNHTSEEYHTRKQFRTGPVPGFLIVSLLPLKDAYWTNQFEHITSGDCPLPCWVTDDLSKRDKVDAIVIPLRDVKNPTSLNKQLSPRDPHQPWIVLSYEAPLYANSRFRTNYGAFNGIFNRTFFFRKDSDIRFVHGFVIDKKDLQYIPPDWSVSNNKTVFTEEEFKKKSLAVAFLSRCNDKSGRMMYIRELRKHAMVDIYGICGKLNCGTRRYVQYNYKSYEDACFKMASEKYLFYLSFENSLCVDYVTEKPYNILYYPLIPVVYGSADYSKLLPPNSYIDARQFSYEGLASEMKRIANNYTEYMKYVKWRKSFQVSTIGGQRPMCDICVKLHQEEFYSPKVIDDFHDWFFVKSHCEMRPRVKSF